MATADHLNAEQRYRIEIAKYGGPVSLDLIEPNIYLGNLVAANDPQTLTKYGITHIITIDTIPLPMYLRELREKRMFKFIQLSDLPKEDLLSHFDHTNEFIDTALNLGGTVLIHCYFGVSRSATVTIAYIMKKYGLTYKQAHERVKRKRSMINPNSGFVSQLNIYQEMGYRIDPNNLKYKLFMLRIAADKVRKVKILPQDYFHLIKPDPGLANCQPEPNVYRCKKCRRVLATERNLLPHKDKMVSVASPPDCTKTYFFEPLSWMDSITQTTQGKLYCPKCKNKLGSFSWTMGCQCPCSTQVAPAFYITPSKVDFTNVVKNVEVTI